MNTYIEASADEYQTWVRQGTSQYLILYVIEGLGADHLLRRSVIDVADAEAYYGVDAHQEAASGRVPVIYISPVDIYALHCILADQLHAIVRLHELSERQIRDTDLMYFRRLHGRATRFAPSSTSSGACRQTRPVRTQLTIRRPLYRCHS